MAAIEVTIAFATLGAACAVGSNVVPKILRDQNERKIAQRDLAELTMNRFRDKSTPDPVAQMNEPESHDRQDVSAISEQAPSEIAFAHVDSDETPANPSSPIAGSSEGRMKRGLSGASSLLASIGTRFARKPKRSVVGDAPAVGAYGADTTDTPSFETIAASPTPTESTRNDIRTADAAFDDASQTEHAMADPGAPNGSGSLKPKKQGRLKFPLWKKQKPVPTPPRGEYSDLFAFAGTDVESLSGPHDTAESFTQANVHSEPTLDASHVESHRSVEPALVETIGGAVAAGSINIFTAHSSFLEAPSSPTERSNKVNLTIGRDEGDESGFLSWSPPLAAAGTESSPTIAPVEVPVREPVPHIADLRAMIEHTADVVEPITVVAPPTWTMEFVEALIANPKERCELVDDLVALGDDLRAGVLAEIYAQDKAIRLVLIAAVSDYASSQAIDVLGRAIRDSDPTLVTTAFDKLLYRGEYELAADALGNVEVAPYALAQLRPYLPDVEARLMTALSEQDADRVRQAMSLA